MARSRVSLALASATILLTLATVTLAQSDPFYDNTPFPQPANQASLQSLGTTSSTHPNEAICTPVSYSTPRIYDLVDEPGPNCSYQSWVAAFVTSPTQPDGVDECKSHCDDSAACRSFAWSLSSSTPDQGECVLDNDFYDPSVIQCDAATNPNSYLGVYNATGWTPPNPLVQNGDFETGCLEPWFFSDFTSDESMVATVIDCAPAGAGTGDCAPNGGGENYVKITGNGQNGSTRDRIDAYIGQKPALEDGIEYRLSASVRGTGEFRFTYPVHTSVKIRASGNATDGWREVSGTLTGRNVGTFLIQMDAPAAAEFAIDDVKIERL